MSVIPINHLSSRGNKLAKQLSNISGNHDKLNRIQTVQGTDDIDNLSSIGNIAIDFLNYLSNIDNKLDRILANMGSGVDNEAYDDISYQRNLENGIDDMQQLPVQGGLELAAIDRRVTIAGQVKRIRANNEQEYMEKIMRLAGVCNSSQQVQAEKHDFKEFALRWYEVFCKPNIQTVTALTYERQFDNIWFPAFEGKAVEDITAEDVQAALNAMGDVTTSTKTKARNVLSMVLDHALEQGLVPRNVVKSKSVKVKGRESTQTEAYTVEQMQYLASHIGDVKNATDRAYLALVLTISLRPEEVLGLKYCDLDWENNEVRVERAVTHPDRNQPEVKSTKTASSKRKLELVSAIRQFIPDGNSDDFILGGAKPLSYQQVKLMRKRIQEDTGFEEKITPERFRHTTLTDIFDQTKDEKATQEAAGHTNSNTTFRHYIHSRNRGNSTGTVLYETYFVK